ncbi:TPA: hypothetical protein KQG29_004228 [Clostridioides difficile]|nr:hypothetical protein [Clostridioides difficile]
MYNLKKNYKFIVLGIIVLTLLLFFLNVTSNNYKFTTINNTQMEKILSKSNNENLIVLIGRPTCGNCAALKPKMEKILKRFKLNAFYYDTKLAREEDEILMEQILGSLGVDQVPILIYFEKNNPKKILKGNDIDTEFVKFIKSSKLGL